jgi:uncharacterized membrane protein YeaQ/YmgE (transglycosylase-associated protein family)
VDILLAFIFGGAYGAVMHYLMPGRTARGSAVAPVLGAVLGGLVWMTLTWAGQTTLDPWLWILSIAVPRSWYPRFWPSSRARVRTTMRESGYD